MAISDQIIQRLPPPMSGFLCEVFMKRKPSGFVAKCQCGVFTGAMDLTAMENKDAGKLLGKWLYDGCTVEPRFGGTWSESINPCLCEKTGGKS